MANNEVPGPVPFSEIGEFALGSAAKARSEAAPFSQAARFAWQNFVQSMHLEGDRWTAPIPKFNELWKNFVAADHLISSTNASALANMAESREALGDDFITLGAFLVHDINHLRPHAAWSCLIEIDNTRDVSGNIWMFDRHKKHIDEAMTRAEQLANLMVLPLEFVYGVAALEGGKELPKRRFNPLNILDIIAFHTKGRFAVDDYEIVKNRNVESNVPTNWIKINSPENLSINANEAMIFSVIYNLVKNAAKANAQQHYEENDQAMDKAYGSGELLVKPRNLTLSLEETDDLLVFGVGDEGLGLSIDDALKRAQINLANLIEKRGIDNIQDSEWYRNVRRTLGHEAELLIAWPTDPFSLRSMKVGSLLDLQFCAGFSGDTWGLRTFTSGTGLWGVRYLTERLGGTVMGTNKFDGGAYFSLALPKKSLDVQRV